MSRYKTPALIVAAGTLPQCDQITPPALARNLKSTLLMTLYHVGAGAAYFAPNFFNPTRTPAVQAIEARYSAGGATPDGESATATRRGDVESLSSPGESLNQRRMREQKADMAGM